MCEGLCLFLFMLFHFIVEKGGSFGNIKWQKKRAGKEFVKKREEK